MVVSAMTVTGLNSVLLADLTIWQQVILFAVANKNSRNPFHAKGPIIYPTKSVRLSDSEKSVRKEKRKKKEKLRADMVRRVDVPVRVNQMNVGGWLRDGEGEASREGETMEAKGKLTGGPLTEEPDESALDDEDDEEDELAGPTFPITPPPGEGKASVHIDEPSKPDRTLHARRSTELGSMIARNAQRRSSMNLAHPPSRDPDLLNPANGKNFPRSRTVEFHDPSELRIRRNRTFTGDPDYPGRQMPHSHLRDHHQRTFTRTPTRSSVADMALHTGFGGFPNPITAIAGFVGDRLGPTLERHVTMPRTTTLQSIHTVGGERNGGKEVSYISFDAVVGRNSKFHGLTTAQQEELGGVEYRALTVLLRIVASYWLFSQLLVVLIIAPWLASSATYAPVFADPPLNTTWFTFFQVWSAWSNNGMSYSSLLSSIFTIMFEVTSSYGTVGLSLGTPTVRDSVPFRYVHPDSRDNQCQKNTSLAGTLRILSKLVLCAVMIRGRHRGLPIAIDRAVLLPSDLVRHNDDTAQSFMETPSEYGAESQTRRNSVGDGNGLNPLNPLTDAQRVRQASSGHPQGGDGIEMGSMEEVEGQGKSTDAQESNSSKEL
ncbi:Trk/Ktr/HKT type cation transporter, partial [Phenoliferia sp. Uapishka_3]